MATTTTVRPGPAAPSTKPSAAPVVPATASTSGAATSVDTADPTSPRASLWQKFNCCHVGGQTLPQPTTSRSTAAHVKQARRAPTALPMAPTTVDVAPLPPAILNARNGIVGNKEALHAEMVGLVHDDKFAERWTSIKAHVEQFIATVEKDTMDGVHGIEAWFQNPANLKAFVTWVNYGGKFGTAVYNQFVRGELPVPTNAQTVVSDLILLLRDFSSLFTGSEKEELTSQQQVLLDTVVDNLEMVRGVAGTPAKAAANGAPEPPAEDAAAAAAAAEPSAAASSSAA